MLRIDLDLAAATRRTRATDTPCSRPTEAASSSPAWAPAARRTSSCAGWIGRALCPSARRRRDPFVRPTASGWATSRTETLEDRVTGGRPFGLCAWRKMRRMAPTGRRRLHRRRIRPDWGAAASAGSGVSHASHDPTSLGARRGTVGRRCCRVPDGDLTARAPGADSGIIPSMRYGGVGPSNDAAAGRRVRPVSSERPLSS